jgi:hypothetical protein
MVFFFITVLPRVIPSHLITLIGGGMEGRGWELDDVYGAKDERKSKGQAVK